jgi:hypothetical protein
MKTDDWFKPAILILAVIFLLVFYLYSLNGRYIPLHTHAAFIDTRNGNVYDTAGIKIK